MKEAQRLTICYFGTYRANYNRNEMILAGLRCQPQVEVITCHVPLWHSVEDRVKQASGAWLRPAFWKRVLSTYWRLIRSHQALSAYDVMVIGYPGSIDAIIGRILTKFRRKPVVIDHYMSLYLIAAERGLVAKSPLTGKLILWLEKLGLHLADLLISDTDAYIQYHCETYQLPKDKFRLVPAGADDRLYRPIAPSEPRDTATCRVLYYGTFIPNHGVPTIIEAAALLQTDDTIQFDFYGEGPDEPEARQRAAREGLTNVTFHGWVEKTSLPAIMANADIILGVFGTTPQSLMTVQNKIWEGCAMQKPVLTGWAQTVSEMFRDQEELFFVERANPQALADGIQQLASDPALRAKLSENGYERSKQNQIAKLGARFAQHLRELVGKGEHA
ncbi:MAG: glycosyltransferase family 4 protein [Candidatus Promineifilaceae bacterium]